MERSPPAALLHFAAHFHRGEYWASHEVLEAPWRTNRSGFYKGLILLASAWVHVQRDNPRGVRAQARKAERELQPYRPSYLGLDVDALLDHLAALRNAVRQDPGSWTLQRAALPALPRLDPAAERIRGDERELR